MGQPKAQAVVWVGEELVSLIPWDSSPQAKGGATSPTFWSSFHLPVMRGGAITPEYKSRGGGRGGGGRRGKGCVTAIKHETERDTTWKRMSQSFLFRRYEPAFKGKEGNTWTW